MPQIPQGANAAQKDPNPLKTHISRGFSGVHTSASRNAIPDDKVYNLENIIPIGPQNAQVVSNLSGILWDFTNPAITPDTIYWAQSASLNTAAPNSTNEYLVLFGTSGRIYLWTPAIPNSINQINFSTPLSGSGSRMAQWSNSLLLFIDSTGYYVYNSTTVPQFQKITGAGVPTAGNEIAVYASRVWITQGRVLFNSGAGDYSAPSWLPQNGAAFNVLIDPTIRSVVTRMVAANGVLYVFANSAIDVIYNVTVPIGAVPPTPTYTLQNIQPLIGTDQPASVIPFDQQTLFANRYGVYGLYGVVAPKLSDDINGTWQHIDFSQPVSAGQVVIENILCAAFLIKRSGDLHFEDGPRLAIWMKSGDANQWWFGSFGNITLVVSAVVNGSATLYGIIDGKLRQFFTDPSTAPRALVETKLWPMEDDLSVKEALRVGFLAEYSIYGSEIDMSVDGLNISADANITLALSQGVWVNALGETGLWQDGSVVPPVIGGWVTTGFLLASGVAPGMFSHNLGLTLTSSGYRYRLNLMAMDYKLRDRWT
jgi:hypothetical protein